ncbi:MAG: lipopolysaccharide biosynthesis protein [Candidatus Omnitrophota bacterium]
MKKKAISGGYWVLGLRFFQQVLYLIRIVVLARILTPKDFGFFSIAALFLLTLKTFSETGFQTAIIQKKFFSRQDIDKYLNTSWTFGIIRAGLIFAFIFFTANFWAKFFDIPQMALLFQVMGLSVIFSSFTNISTVLFQKELNFKKYFTLHLASNSITLLTSILLAVLYKNVWALVWGHLAGILTHCFLSYQLDPYRPKFFVSRKALKELFKFGKWILGSHIIVFLITKGDDLFVGKIIGATALGLYQMAYLISNLPVTEVTHIVSKVLFPVYSQVQNNRLRLKRIYLQIHLMIAFITFPLISIIIIFSPALIYPILGEQWVPIIPAIQILAVWGLVRSIGATTGPIFLGIGRPHIATKLQFLQLIMLALTIYPLSKTYGFNGTAMAVVISSIIPNIWAYIKVRNILNFNFKDFFIMFLLPLINTLVMTLVIIVIKSVIFSSCGSNLAMSALLIGIAICIYTFCSFYSFKYYNLDIKGLLLKLTEI